MANEILQIKRTACKQPDCAKLKFLDVEQITMVDGVGSLGRIPVSYVWW